MAGFNDFFNWYHDNGILPNIWKGATGQLSQEKINNENLQYQKERNAIEDARYENETAYNRAFAEDERTYQRAFSAEEQSYNRAFAENERAYQREWDLNQRDYERSLQEKMFEREDTAIARQSEALRAQGINPLSQSMNGLGAGSVVSSSPSRSTGYSGSSAGSSVSAPALSGRQGKALQKAMITAQGINGLLGPILQTMNTVDNLRGSGIQRDILNANAMQAQAEANMSIMEMFDMSNHLNMKSFNFPYGKGQGKNYFFSQTDESYKPYFYSPQQVQIFEQNPKRLQSLTTGRQADNLDSVHDAMSFMTGKLSDYLSSKLGIDIPSNVQDSFTSIVESLVLNAFKNVSTPSNQISNKNKKKK